MGLIQSTRVELIKLIASRRLNDLLLWVISVQLATSLLLDSSAVSYN